MPPSTPQSPNPTIISPKPKPSTKTPPLLLLQNNLQKILPKDPIEEILRKSSDSHIRSLLRSLCSSSQEIKEKAQQLHKQILELPVVPPPGIDLSDGNYIVIPNKYNPRKRKPWNISSGGGGAAVDGNTGGGGGINAGIHGGVVVGMETTGRRYRGQETYNRMMSSFYQTERNARRRFRFGRFEMGGSSSNKGVGGGDNETKTSSRKKSQDQLSPTSNNNTSRPVSPRTKVLEMNPRDYIQPPQPPPAYSPPLSITSLDRIDYNNQERVSTLESEYHQCITTSGNSGSNNVGIGGFAEVEPIRLPSINETIFRRMSYSLELPPILGLGLEVNCNVMDAVTAELSYTSMNVRGLEPGEIRSAAAGGLEF
ncbi:hypothetical protein TWF225_004297 [Orbilia oligospora]|nr:hypothetical protein TWF225_004297 [Orbilia oligospora]KAF3258584.1 hypothetical protein TWF217_005361 [Orbilia oligospora]KAF3267018.1 hypothetical protein TWF128_009980 [Orbilia oligospora]KAF3295450.1 hypothetical protein TWF132_001499 [Orbilia oligospora]